MQQPLTSPQGLRCANCGTPLQGEFCHACGRSIHSVPRPAHGMIEETLETVFDLDVRIVHTLPPLLFKPGALTLEYFSGRRVRYIAPFRWMFMLCLFLSLLLIAGAGVLSFWLRSHAAWTANALHPMQETLLLWIPIYLLIMQKHTCRRGWALTVLKFCCVGWCHLWLLLVASIIAVALGATN